MLMAFLIVGIVVLSTLYALITVVALVLAADD